MKRLLTFFGLCLIAAYSYGQYRYSLTYDAAGNRTVRKYVPSTIMMDEDDEEKEIASEMISDHEVQLATDSEKGKV